MERKANIKKWIFFILFILLNGLNCFLCTTSFFNNNLSPFPLNGIMILNYIIGSFGTSLFFLGIGILIFHSDRHRSQYLLCVTLFNTILCFALCVFVYNFGMMFSFKNLKALNNPAGEMAYEFFFDALLSLLANAQYLTLIPFILLLIYYFIFLNKKHNEIMDASMFGGFKIKKIFGIVILVISLLFSSTSSILYSARITNTWFEKNDEPLYGIQNCGLWNYYVKDAIDCYLIPDKLSKKDKESTLNELAYYQEKERTNEIDGNIYGNSQYEGCFTNKNLILLQMESMNNFTIGLSVNGKEITPNINKMIEEGIYCNQFYTTVGIGNTSDAEFSAMTGLRPTGSTMTVYENVNHEYPTLARDFKAKGYQTFSIHGNTGVFYNRTEVHTNTYGFDYHYDISLFIENYNNYNNYIHTRIADEDLLTETVSLMTKSTKPTFAFAILVSCHIPYEEDSNVRKVLDTEGFSLKNDVKGKLLRGYLEHTHYVDYCIGKLLDSLEENNLLENTVIALYGDHGGTISHHDFHRDASIFNYIDNINNFNDMNWRNLDKFAFRKITQEIPFVIYDCAKSKNIIPQTISKIRSQVDIKRTMDSLFNLDTDYYFGVDILSNEPTIHYSPRTLDVISDYGMISASSLKTYPINNNIIDNNIKDKLQDIKDLALKQKQLNDRLLKNDLFFKKQE